MVKGAPDVLLERCVYGPAGELTMQDRRRILAANEDMARRAMRVIAVARRELAFLPNQLQSETVEQELTFLGLFGLTDPPRQEVRGAVEQIGRASCRERV